MALDSCILDKLSGVTAKVSQYGELAVAPLEYDETSVQIMSVINTAYNFAPPKAGKRIIVTGVILNADKNVSGTAEATINIYSADGGPDDIAIFKNIIQINLIKQQQIPLLGLNIITPPGVWVSGKTDDNSVSVTLMYHYIGG